MGKEIQWDWLEWTEGDDFISFAFGDFNSRDFNIVRTSNGGRYDDKITPPLTEITADVPGRDGSYYFGTTYKPKVFDVNFAFEGLTKEQIRNIKAIFSGKDMRELCFAESCEYVGNNITDARIYMAKVTGQPNLKYMAFGDGDNERYNGEGTIQFTAYWPFARRKNQKSLSLPDDRNEGSQKQCYFNVDGDVPTNFVLTSSWSSECDVEIYIKKDGATIYSSLLKAKIPSNGKWDSDTGIVFDAESKPTAQQNQTCGAILGDIKITYSITSSYNDAQGNISFYEWYY